MTTQPPTSPPPRRHRPPIYPTPKHNGTHDRLRMEIMKQYRRVRRRKSISLYELEELLSIPRTTLAEHERGLWCLPVETFCRWCQVIGVRPGEVLDPIRTTDADA